MESERRKWLILSTVSVGSLMSTLDGSIVNIALPNIGQDFAIDLTTVEWVVVAYLLVIGALLLPFGRLGEVLTFKRVYLAGFSLFTAASVLCGAAPGPAALVAFRVLQAVGGAMLMAMGPAIVARTFPPRQRGQALGLNGISVSIGLSLGPALGGVLTQIATWRAIFFINLPIGIFAIVWAYFQLPAEERTHEQRFDIPGATLSAAALFALLLALSEGQKWGWTNPAIVGLIVAFAVLATAFVWVEWHAPQPMIDLSLFRIRPFSAGLASVVVAFAGLFTATFLLPFLLEESRGFSPIEAGLLLTPVPITMAIVAPISGTLSDRVGPRWIASGGILVMTVGLLSLTWLPIEFSIPDLVWRLVLLGVGQGMFMSPNSSAVLGSVPRARVGTASGTLAQMRVNGQALGIAISAAVVAIRLPAYLAALGVPAGQFDPVAQANAIHDAFVVAAAICAVGIVTSLVRGTARDEAVAAAGPGGSPVASPVGSPTGSPAGSPVGSPTGSPVGSPVGSPTGSPVGSPAGSSAASPAGSPAALPPRRAERHAEAERMDAGRIERTERTDRM